MANGAFMWHDQYLNYNFGKNHPFKTIKYKLFKELINDRKLNIPEVTVANKFTTAQLKTIFEPFFIDELLHKEQEPGSMLDPGTPAFPNMVEITSFAVYGTYQALKMILNSETKYAFNCLGGLHHGKPDAAFGGCILNDMGFSINWLRKEGIKERFAIIDVDFHPHDGTVAFLKDDPNVLLVSIHEQGWFGFDDEYYDDFYSNIVNVPIKSNFILTEDEYKNIFDKKIVLQVRNFRPDIIIYVNGVDGHINDAVTYYGKKEKSISLSNETYNHLAETVAKLAMEICDG